MKRAILIAGGTVGGLGAVLSVTPPQLSDNGLSTLSGASAATSITPEGTTVANENAAAVVTKKPVVKKKTPVKKISSGNNQKSVVTPTPTPTPTAKSQSATGVSGQFIGDAVNVGYGMVQVKITVSNGKITEAEVLQAPNGRSQRFTDYAVPNLRSQTLSAQSAAINGVSGASYTSYGWYKSLITALQKAGMSTGV